MPIDNLKELKKHFNSIVFVSYLTIQPERAVVDDFVKAMSNELLGDNSEIWLIGRMTEFINQNAISGDVKVFNSISDLIQNI
jgi:hypothetical protein